MTMVFEQMDLYGHEQIVFGRDDSVGLKCIIAIHDTTLGPALGGTRFWNYESEEAALYDVLRLSRGMTYKNAACGLANGGGKAVIWGDPKKLKSREFWHAYGRIVDGLNGNFITAEDVNTNTQDIEHIHEVTNCITGTEEIGGNPSPYTARGTWRGMKAGAKVKFGTDSLRNRVIMIQGLGNVGYGVAELAHSEGAILKVYDINEEAVKRAVKELGAVSIPAEEVISTECDIFAPCALGAVLNTKNVHDLKCKLVCGCANNVLVDAETGEELQKLGILYAPDYIVNAGGVLNCGAEISAEGYNKERVIELVDRIYDTTLEIFEIAEKDGVTTYEAAERFAEAIIAKGKK